MARFCAAYSSEVCGSLCKAPVFVRAAAVRRDRLPVPGVISVEQAADQAGRAAGVDPSGGAAGLLDAAAGDRAGQDLHAGVLVAAEPDRRADQCADRVGVEVAADRQRLGAGQPQLAADHQPPLPLVRGRQGRLGGADAGVRAGPGRLDGAFDQAGWDDTGHPQPDRDPGLGEHVLARHVRLAGERPPPGRAQQPDEVGPQRRPARGIHLWWGEHGDLTGVGRAAARGSAAPTTAGRPRSR